jgi:hypothetical protein
MVQSIEKKMKEHSLMQVELRDKRKAASTHKNQVSKEYAAKLEVCQPRVAVSADILHWQSCRICLKTCKVCKTDVM